MSDDRKKILGRKTIKQLKRKLDMPDKPVNSQFVELTKESDQAVVDMYQAGMLTGENVLISARALGLAVYLGTTDSNRPEWIHEVKTIVENVANGSIMADVDELLPPDRVQ